MASLLFSNSLSLTRPLSTTPTTAFFKHPRLQNSPAIRFHSDPTRPKTRPLTLVARAGPSTSNYIFAFALPLSLLVITVFASIRVADKLEKDYLEELAINEAIREVDEEDDDDEEGDTDISLQEEPALPRARNRPIREV